MHTIEYKAPGKGKKWHKIEVVTTSGSEWIIDMNGTWLTWTKTTKLNTPVEVEEKFNELMAWAIRLIKSDVPVTHEYLSGDIVKIIKALDMESDY